MTRSLALCYHAVSERWDAALSVTPRAFEAQVARLVRRGYDGVTFSELVERGGDRLLAITFDDAYRSVITTAKPILDRYELPATVYVPTKFAGTEQPMSWPGVAPWIGTKFESELIPMSWQELGDLVACGWEIGSHTCSHPHLTAIDDAALERELGDSRSRCEHKLGLACRSLAYPYGDHDERVVAAAAAAGYESAATLPAFFSPSPSPLAYPRVGVYFGDHMWRFRVKTSSAVRRLRAVSPLHSARRTPPRARG